MKQKKLRFPFGISALSSDLNHISGHLKLNACLNLRQGNTQLYDKMWNASLTNIDSLGESPLCRALPGWCNPASH